MDIFQIPHPIHTTQGIASVSHSEAISCPKLEYIINLQRFSGIFDILIVIHVSLFVLVQFRYPDECKEVLLLHLWLKLSKIFFFVRVVEIHVGMLSDLNIVNN